MQLEQGQKRFADILPDALIQVDQMGYISWLNLAAAKLLNINRERLPSINLQHLVFFNDFAAFIRQNPDYTMESYCQIIADTYLSIQIIHRHEHKILLLLRNITHLHYLEKIRQDFVANVSHELRTPLTVIHGYLELLLSDDQVEIKPWKKILMQMYQQGLRMEKLVEDLLLLSRLESQPEDQAQKIVPVSRMLESICQDAKILSGEREHQLHLSSDGNLCLYGNENELHAAFSNIIFNAVHYTFAKGVIDVSWHLANKKEAVLMVKDTGIGIDAEDIPRITERFYRVDKARSRESGGTGLGLAIVKHVLIRHEARLEIESQVGIGSTFKCIFSRHRLHRHSQKVS